MKTAWKISDAHNPKPRTLDQVKAHLADLKANGEPGLDAKMASMMLRHGRLTDEARNYVARYLESE